MSKNLTQRWAKFKQRNSRKATGPGRDQGKNQAKGQPTPEDALPEILDQRAISGLLHERSSHRLEHLIERAVTHTALLKQMRHRVTKESSSDDSSTDEWLRENIGHTFENWRIYLTTLEMIAQARQSLRSAPLPEKILVDQARSALAGKPRHLDFLG